MQFPNYSKSSYNVINSILHYYGVNNNQTSLPELDNILNTKKYKKIIFLVMDGMGNNLINKYLKDSFLAKYNMGPISSVLPSTTTAAMNTYYSGLQPIEHAWLGWSCFFKECSRTINLFPGTDKYTNDPVNFNYLDIIKYKDIFTQIKEVNDVEQIVIQPKYLSNNYPVKNVKVKNINSLVKQLKKQSKGNKNKFIFAYCAEPDSLEHKLGPSDKNVENILVKFNKLIEKKFKKIKDDTLLIISADHGQIDVEETVYLEDYKDLLDTLIMLPSIEPRAASFFVKKDKKLEFETLFNDIFKDKYVLFKKEEVLRHRLFGNNTPHFKVDDFLGDYLAIGIGRTIIDYKRDENGFIFKGHHAGLHSDEVNIPLIVIKK